MSQRERDLVAERRANRPLVDNRALFAGSQNRSTAAVVLMLGLVIFFLIVGLLAGWFKEAERVVVAPGEYIYVRNTVTGERRVISEPGNFTNFLELPIENARTNGGFLPDSLDVSTESSRNSVKLR